MIISQNNITRVIIIKKIITKKITPRNNISEPIYAFLRWQVDGSASSITQLPPVYVVSLS
jgi:hypothetical protein